MDSIQDKLKNMISVERYNHSIGVQETAIKLADRYGANSNKASIAGLVHDCAKGLNHDEMLKAAKKYGIEVNDVTKSQPGLLHGPVGSCMARELFSINDEEVLHAIWYHTTGCRDMSLLDKIIYIADYIEPSRDFKGVDKLRAAAFQDIDRAVLLALDNTIKFVIEKNQLLDLLTIEARNFMLVNH
jgi:predicted HD superfamily hydrolase involved in NAD metabolism